MMEKKTEKQIADNADKLLIRVCEWRHDFELRSDSFKNSQTGKDVFSDMEDLFNASLTIKKVISYGRL